MNQRPPIVAVFAAAMLAVWAGGAQAQAKPTAIAVVNIEKVFGSLKEREAIEADGRQEGDQLQQEQATRRAAISEDQNRLDLLPPGSEAYKKAEAELQQKVISLQVWGQFHQNRLARERAVLTEKLYRKTLETIGRVATENGYDIVLFKEQAPNFEGVNPQQLPTILQLRKVLWSKDEIDLTEQVTTRMNNEFDAAR